MYQEDRYWEKIPIRDEPPILAIILGPIDFYNLDKSDQCLQAVTDLIIIGHHARNCIDKYTQTTSNLYFYIINKCLTAIDGFTCAFPFHDLTFQSTKI